MKLLACFLTATAAACAPVTAERAPDSPGGDGGVDARAAGVDGVARAGGEALPPVGYGTLRQEAFTVTLRSRELLVKVTPLGEAVIRLAAPDTYGRLHALADSRRLRAARSAGRATVEPFLVSFFSYEPDVTFQPRDINLEHQGRLLRPLAIVPITPGWGRQRLRQQEAQSAVYGFDADIDLALPMTVRYGSERSDAWNDVIPRLETEYARVRSQAGR